MEPDCCSLEEVLARLDEVSPGAPFLALGQTVLWDEPMKAGIAAEAVRLGRPRKIVAGIHDTDYFAKTPTPISGRGRYVAVSHNDTTTRGLWSAASEFSCLFGSETVISRHDMARSGLRLHRVMRERPAAIDEATEAWGWRGLVSLDDNPPISSEVPYAEVAPELRSTFDWALDASVEMIEDCCGEQSVRARAETLRGLLCPDLDAPPGQTLSDFYQGLLPTLYRLNTQVDFELDTTSTRELLRFNTETVDRPRFDIARCFLDPKTRPAATDAYNEAVRGSEVYTLDRFGTGAIPFDLVIPGKGRGTVRIGTRGAVIHTPEPQFLSFRRPITALDEFAAAVEAKFGPNCCLVGKAVSLIAMLAREFVFVFHEGASGYVRYSRQFLANMASAGLKLDCHPILRVRYQTWDAMQNCRVWFRLPEPLRQAFGTEELYAPSFAARWREVAREQGVVLSRLSQCRSPRDLISFLDERTGGAWEQLREDYERLSEQLERLLEHVRKERAHRAALLVRLKELKASRVDAERAKGDHFRAKVFGKDPTPADLEERAALSERVEGIIREIAAVRQALRASLDRQNAVVRSAETLEMHRRKDAIELEAELKRMRLIRQATIASKGLQRAGYRPSAWWFPLVCPEGHWFQNTIRSAECYLEPLGERGAQPLEAPRSLP